MRHTSGGRLPGLRLLTQLQSYSALWPVKSWNFRTGGGSIRGPRNRSNPS